METFLEPGLEPILKHAFICRSPAAEDNGGMTPGRAVVARPRPAAARAAAGKVARGGVLLLAALAATLVRAGDQDDQDRARAAVQSGAVLPLPDLLVRLQRSHPGQVLELELEQEDGRWIYEIRLLQADGQLLKLEVDARTGQVLAVRRKGERRETPR
jgi:uncharacterized membrane protein YkoI